MDHMRFRRAALRRIVFLMRVTIFSLMARRICMSLTKTLIPLIMYCIFGPRKSLMGKFVNRQILTAQVMATST